jgi:hypothetical protein
MKKYSVAQGGASIVFPKRFDRGNCNNEGFTVPKSKREERQDRRNPAPNVGVLVANVREIHFEIQLNGNEFSNLVVQS